MSQEQKVTTKISERPKISLLGVTANTDNYGVRVLLSSAIGLLAGSYPGAEITLLDYGRNPDRWCEKLPSGPREIRLVNLRFSWRLHLGNNIFRLLSIVILTRLLPTRIRLYCLESNAWLREILGAEAHFSLAGGDSFSDIYGVSRFLYVALPQLLVVLIGRPLVLLPQTYGPFKSRFARLVARYIIRRAKVVFSRDEEGMQTIKTLMGATGPVVRSVPDLGFSMNQESLDAALESQLHLLHAAGPLVGLNISSLLFMGGYSRDNMFQLREEFPKLIHAVVEYVTTTLHAQILLVPHVCGGIGSEEDETRLCRRLVEDYGSRFGHRVHYLDQDLNHRQMKALIGRCDIFIGARMHACIGAVSQAVPSVCLAYSLKFAGVMKPLGSGACVMNLRTTTIPELLNAISDVFNRRGELRTELQRNLPVVLERLNSVADGRFGMEKGF